VRSKDATPLIDRRGCIQRETVFVAKLRNGVKFGRPAKLTPHQRKEALKRREAGEAHTDIARDFNVSHQTIGRLRP